MLNEPVPLRLLVNHAVILLLVSVVLDIMVGCLRPILAFCVHLGQSAREAEIRCL